MSTRFRIVSDATNPDADHFDAENVCRRGRTSWRDRELMAKNFLKFARVGDTRQLRKRVMATMAAQIRTTAAVDTPGAKAHFEC
jgi:hypothetical protein